MTLNAPMSQFDSYIANEIKFQIINDDDTFDPDELKDAEVLVTLLTSDGVSETLQGQWLFNLSKVNPAYGLITCECEDFIARYLKGDYPSEPSVNDLFPPLSSDVQEENTKPFCVPIPFGTAYIPLKCVPISQYLRGYLLGPDANTFAVNEITSPRAVNAEQIWEDTDAAFSIRTESDRFDPPSDWKILFPYLINSDPSLYAGTHTGANSAADLADNTKNWTADSLIGMRIVNDTDGSAAIISDNGTGGIVGALSGGADNDWDTGDAYHVEAPGLWRPGSEYLNILAQIERDDLSSVTSPADHLEFVFEDFGIPSGNIGTGVGSSFEGAASTFSSWGLEYNGAYYFRQPKEKVLSSILNMCHSTIDITTKVDLRVLSKTSVLTLDDNDIIGKSFTHNFLAKNEYDSAHIAFSETGKPQDQFLKLRVPVKNDMDKPSAEVFEIPFVQDSQIAQKLGMLKFQRKFYKEANITFRTHEDILNLVKPDQVITLNHSNYGGNFDVVVDTIHIGRGLELTFNCTKYSIALDDFTDLSPVAVSMTDDGVVSKWQPVIAGPDSVTPGTGNLPHVIPGKLRVGVSGSAILIDPTREVIETLDYVSGNAGRGFHLSPELLETGNAAIRGLLRMAVLQYGNILACGGSQYVTKGADVLATDMTAADNSTVEIKNDSGAAAWSADDVLWMRNENDAEWFQITSVSGNVYTCDRDKGSSYGVNSNPEWPKGTAVVNFGQSGDGGLYFTASDTNAPYLEIFTHAGSPWAGLTTRMRLGNLNGFLGYVSKLFGMAIGETTKYISYEPTNGLRLIGPGITAGSIQSSDWASAAGVMFDLVNRWLKMGGSNVDGAGSATGIFAGLEGGYYKLFAGSTSQYINFTGTLLKLACQFYGAAAGNFVEAQDNAEIFIPALYGAVKYKEFTIGRGGEYRIVWQMALVGFPPYTCYGRVYRNGGAVGTTKSTSDYTGTYYSFSDDVGGWSPGDLCQIYLWSDYGPGVEAKIKNAKVKTSNPIMTIGVEADV